VNELNHFSIQSKLLIMYMSITGIVLVLAFVIVARINLVNAEANIISGLNVVADIIADSSAASLAFSDSISAGRNLRSLKSHHSIVYACIRTVDNQEFAAYNLNLISVFSCDDYAAHDGVELSGDYVDVFRSIVLEDQSIGMLQIKASLSELNEITIRSAKISALIFIGLMLLTAFMSKRIMRLITDPITKLKELSQKVTENKDYSLRMKKHADDEVGVLIASFNNMLEQIENRDSALIEEKEKAEKYALETEETNKVLGVEIRERAKIEEQLQNLNETLEDKVHERTSELKQLNEKIGDVARSAGMAEVASGVLHNVGNVLNSVNVSASVIRDQIRKTKAGNLQRVVALLEEHEEDMAEFICKDEKGRQIPRFLSLLSNELSSERENIFNELDELSNNIDHIKNVISMQQSYAGSYGVRDKVKLSALVEDALKISLQEIDQHGFEVIRKYTDIPELYIDRHRVLQIIINLVSNAKYALADGENEKKSLLIKIEEDNGMAKLVICDTGIGIDQADIAHLFEYGFKKRRDGHGFGLHHSAIVTSELGGKISVISDGAGKGACFTLTLPYDLQLDE